jgi:hypothetical protein
LQLHSPAPSRQSRLPVSIAIARPRYDRAGHQSGSPKDYASSARKLARALSTPDTALDNA